jgi:hypothetical protein
MGTSAFDLIVLPVLMAALGAMVGGSVLISLIHAVEIILNRLGLITRAVRPRPTLLRVVRIHQERAHPRLANRPRLVG